MTGVRVPPPSARAALPTSKWVSGEGVRPTVPTVPVSGRLHRLTWRSVRHGKAVDRLYRPCERPFRGRCRR